MATANSQYAGSQGQTLLDQFGNVRTDQQNQANFTGGVAGAHYMDVLQQAGYTPAEANAIINQYGVGNIPGLDTQGTLPSKEAISNFLTEQEKAAMTGNPYEATSYENSGQIRTSLGTDLGAQKDAVTGLKNDLNNSIDPEALKLDPRYAGALTGKVNDTGNYLAGKVDTAGKNLSGITDKASSGLSSVMGDTTGRLDKATSDPGLDLMSDYASREEMTPEQEQDIVNAAGTTVANKNQAALDDMYRRANAAGIGTLGQAAYRGRMTRQAESDAADAMTNARIAASNAAAERLQKVQDTSLSAAGARAGLRVNAGEALGSMGTGQQEYLGTLGTGQQEDLLATGVQTGEYTGTQNVNALEDIEQRRQSDQQQLTADQLDAAKTGGLADVQNAQNATGRDIDTQQNIADREVRDHQAAEAAATARGTDIAKNDQATTQGNNTTNYNRGVTASNALSSRTAQVATNRQDQADKAAAGLETQATREQQAATAAGGQQNTTFGTTTSAENNAAQVQSGAQNQPGLGERIFDTVVGGAATAAKGLSTLKFEDGGVATKPTLATLGENGPEQVFSAPKPSSDPLDHMGNAYSDQGAKMTPSMPPKYPTQGRYGDPAPQPGQGGGGQSSGLVGPRPTAAQHEKFMSDPANQDIIKRINQSQQPPPGGWTGSDETTGIGGQYRNNPLPASGSAPSSQALPRYGQSPSAPPSAPQPSASAAPASLMNGWGAPVGGAPSFGGGSAAPAASAPASGVPSMVSSLYDKAQSQQAPLGYSSQSPAPTRYGQPPAPPAMQSTLRSGGPAPQPFNPAIAGAAATKAGAWAPQQNAGAQSEGSPYGEAPQIDPAQRQQPQYDPQPNSTMVTQPTRALLNRGDAVVPMRPGMNAKMRPGSMGQAKAFPRYAV